MVKRFLEYVTVEKRYSSHTCISYAKDLEDFTTFLLETESHEDFHKVDKKIVRNFMVHLNLKSLSKRSINRKLSTLRSFYLFLLKVGEVDVSPMESIQSLKFYAEKQIPFSEEEMQQERLLSPKSGANSFLKEVIVEMLYQTGMRRAELVNLRVDQVDFGKNELRVVGKGNKERIIPISEELATILKQYAAQRKPLTESEMYFLINAKGKKINDKFVYSAVNSYLSLVSSKKKKSPHILRHSFATHVLDHGAEISKVKTILGHASLASTQVYTTANIEQLKKVFNQAHPRAKKE